MLLLAQTAESRLFPDGLTQGRGTGVREPQNVQIIPEGPNHLQGPGETHSVVYTGVITWG